MKALVRIIIPRIMGLRGKLDRLFADEVSLPKGTDIYLLVLAAYVLRC